MRLNLGSCDRGIPGFLSVDICPPADVLVDLSKPWPWLSSSVSAIKAYDIIEHLPNKILTMNEAWRVLRPGACIEIDVPTTDGRGAWQDPTHVSYWNRNSFLYYTAGDPHRERFGVHYGITARFKVVNENVSRYPDGVVKLQITLEAVK